MASKRLGSSLEDSSNTGITPKKPKLEIKPVKAFCGISDITPQTATLPQESETTNNVTAPTTGQANGSPINTWLVVEHWHSNDPYKGRKSMVKILGVFNNATAALEHAEEHTRALYTVCNYGIEFELEAEDEDDRASEDMSPTSIYERRMKFFLGEWEREEEEDLENGLKKWTIHWNGVTEVWVEQQQVCETKDDAGYFTPLPVDDNVPGKEW